MKRAIGRIERTLFALVVCLAPACTGQIGENDGTGAPGSGGPGSRGGGAAAPGTPVDVKAVCNPAAPSPGLSPLRRLTHREYDATVRDLLGDDTHPAVAFAPEEHFLGFDNNAETRGVTSLLAEQYMNAAEQIASRAA